MIDFSLLKKNLKKDFSLHKKIKIALLGDSATQLLIQALRGAGFEFGWDLQIWEADYNQIDRQIMDPQSALYEFNPEIVIIFQSAHKLLGKFNKLELSQQPNLAASENAHIVTLYALIQERLHCPVILYNYNEIDDAIFGNFATKTNRSFIFQLRTLNYQLMLLAAEKTNLFLCDIASIQNQLGKNTFFTPALYINTEMVLSLDALAWVAYKTLAIINALQGKLKKCLIIDLDNTIWGGIIGDDGLENIQLGSLGIGKAFTEFQYWIKQLKNRGIIIAVCSKNTETVAKEPFIKHPDMVLHLEDIAVFVANWDNKADNIRKIQSILNIGFDSMVFLDDNPFERNIVRENIPDICVPELPEDPAAYLEYLYTLSLFETVSISAEDAERTKLYQTEAERVTLQQKFTNETDFLKSLEMISLVEPFNAFNTPRVAQLSQRSNQFNLRTIRYTEQDIVSLSGMSNYFTFSFTLDDKFGSNGLIAVVILKKETPDTVFIENWLMSCRVLKRGMEHFILNTIVNFAREKGCLTLKGEYIPTLKNSMVAEHYQNLGFEEKEGFWYLNLQHYIPKTCFIANK